MTRSKTRRQRSLTLMTRASIAAVICGSWSCAGTTSDTDPTATAPTPDTDTDTDTGEDTDTDVAGGGSVSIEYIAHACFRIEASTGESVLIDPYASKIWLGYDFPADVQADAFVVTHPHYDHDAGQFVGRPFPWGGAPQFSDPGDNFVGAIAVHGIEGRHAEPYGREFDYKNTMFVIEVDGVRIAHVGDNGPIDASVLADFGRVDILMLPIDADEHIMTFDTIDAIRTALTPAITIPMHYRIPELESSPDSPQDLGDHEPWSSAQAQVVHHPGNLASYRLGELPSPELAQVDVFEHAPYVTN